MIPAGPGPLRDMQRWGGLLIVLAVLLVYWPLSTLQYGVVPGDTLDCWLPWRWFIAGALHDGHFPLWNPYAQSGYPIYADLQGPAWYPLSIALGGTLGHNLFTLQFLFLFYVCLGALGMRHLVQQQYRDPHAALVVGLAYGLSGFFTGHQMHFYAVISAAWLPWLIAAQLRLIAAPGWRPAVAAAVVQALLLTGGNHTFTLIGSWLLLALIAAQVAALLGKGEKAAVRRLLRFQLLFAGLVVLMACGTFFAWAEVSPHIDRAGGMAYADAAVLPFSPRAWISFFFPYATGTDGDWLGTDPTMANGYVGVGVLVLAVLSLFAKRGRSANVIAIFGLVCALASLGAHAPVHRWLWAVVPGLDLFRFPSYYQWFVAFALLYLAAGAVAEWPVWRFRNVRALRTTLAAFSALLLALVVWAWLHKVHEPALEWNAPLFPMLAGAWRWHRVLAAALLVLPAFAGFCWWALKAQRTNWLLPLLVLLEMGWSTALAQWNTAVGDYAPIALQARIDRQPQGPVWPGLHPMAMNADGPFPLKYLWRNVQDFVGGPSHDGFNSFWLKESNNMPQDHPQLFAEMLAEPLVYLAEETHPAGNEEVVVHALGAGNVAMAGFDHNSIAMQVRTDTPAVAVLQQAWYPGWRVEVDGAPAELLRTNYAFMGVRLPAGAHEVDFRFAKPVVPLLLAVSLLVFMGCAAWLAFGLAGAYRPWALGGWLVLAVALGWSLFGHRAKTDELPAGVQGLVADMAGSGHGPLPVLVNTDRVPVLDAYFKGLPVHWLRATGQRDMAQAAQQVKAVGEQPFWWLEAGLSTPPGLRAYLLSQYRVAKQLSRNGCRALLLGPATDGLPNELLHTDEAPALLDQERPWTTAFRIPVGQLLPLQGALWVTAEYTASADAVPMLVIETRRNDAITGYESIPLSKGGGALTASWVQNLMEFRDRRDELGIYLWNNGTGTMEVTAWRVQRTHKDLERW